MHKIRIKKLDSIPKRAIGLIGSKTHSNVLIQTRFGIHTIGLKFPIDVLVLDKDHKVVKMKKSLRPYRIFLWNPKHNLVCEIEEGSIDKLKIKLHDQIKLEFSG